MIHTNLILVEGIAGTGKTTMAKKLGEWLGRSDRIPEVYAEFAEPHPLHEWGILDPVDWASKTLQNWGQLVQRLVNRKSIGIVESTFFQGTIGQLLEWNQSDATIHDYVHQLAGLLAPASPVLIYLTPDDLEKHIRRTYASRSAKWRRKIDGFIQGTAFGHTRGISGLDGYLQFIESLRRLSDEAFSAVSIPKVEVSISNHSYDTCERLIAEFLVGVSQSN